MVLYGGIARVGGVLVKGLKKTILDSFDMEK